jgi:hypothetical protein
VAHAMHDLKLLSIALKDLDETGVNKAGKRDVPEWRARPHLTEQTTRLFCHHNGALSRSRNRG